MLPPHNCDLTWTTLLYSITLGSSWNWISVHPCELHIWALWNSYILTCKWASVLQSWAMKGLGFLHIYSPVQSSILSVTRNHLRQGGVRFPFVVSNQNKSSLYPLCVPQTLLPKDTPSHTLWLQPSDQNASPCLYTKVQFDHTSLWPLKTVKITKKISLQLIRNLQHRCLHMCILIWGTNSNVCCRWEWGTVLQQDRSTSASLLVYGLYGLWFQKG